MQWKLEDLELDMSISCLRTDEDTFTFAFSNKKSVQVLKYYQLKLMIWI